MFQSVSSIISVKWRYPVYILVRSSTALGPDSWNCWSSCNWMSHVTTHYYNTGLSCWKRRSGYGLHFVAGLFRAVSVRTIPYLTVLIRSNPYLQRSKPLRNRSAFVLNCIKSYCSVLNCIKPYCTVNLRITHGTLECNILEQYAQTRSYTVVHPYWIRWERRSLVISGHFPGSPWCFYP